MATSYCVFTSLPFQEQIVLVWDERRNIATHYEAKTR